MAQFRAVGIVSGPSQHLKGVPFVSELWWGTYGLCAVRPQRTPTVDEMSTFGSTTLHISTSLARGRHVYWSVWSVHLHSCKRV